MSKSAPLYMLADIGGTHARIAAYDGNKMTPARIYKTSEYEAATELFARFRDDENLPKDNLNVAIAAAGRMDKDNIWRIGNNKDWAINVAAFEESRFPIVHICGDFEATAYGVAHMHRGDTIVLKEGDTKDFYKPRVVCGPGTGLGLAYAIPGKAETRIQHTYGGHFPASPQTEEQTLVMRLVKQLGQHEYTVSFEDIVSGRGLPVLHRAVCLMHGLPEKHDTSQGFILENKDDVSVQETLRLFFEFFGLFLQTAVITGDAYGGVYLDGGLIQFLVEKNLIDTSSMLHFMSHNSFPVIRDYLEATPVAVIDTPFIALQGLKSIVDEGKHKDV